MVRATISFDPSERRIVRTFRNRVTREFEARCRVKQCRNVEVRKIINIDIINRIIKYTHRLIRLSEFM